MNRHTWLVVGSVAVVALCVVFVAGFEVTDRYPRTHETIARAKHIVEGCGMYRDAAANPERGKYPHTLAELAKPSWGGGPYVFPGDERLKDSWGNPYRYAVVTDARGEHEVYVWAEREVGGKLRLFGAKRLAGGEVVLFGLPE